MNDTLQVKTKASHILFSNISQAFKQNFIPGLILQLFACLVALSFFFFPASHVFFNFFSDLKEQHGALYALVSTALFGGLIPFTYLYLTKKIQHHVLGQLCFYCGFWALKGVEVDWFYQLQAQWFGNASDVKTIATKTLVDQMIYSAFWSAPTITLLYLWKDYGFSWTRLKADINKELFLIKIPTTVISNWMVWIPAVIIIYSMPPALQLPLFNLVLCFFVLLLSVLSRNSQSNLDRTH